MKKQMFDRLPIRGTRRITPEGYLKATASVTTVGIQYYYGMELEQFGFNVDPQRKYGVFRGKDTVFHADTMNSLKLKPITREHPDVDVNAHNFDLLSVGIVGETVEPIDGMCLGASIQITDAQTVQDVDKGLCEVSLGYDCDIIEESGVYEGESFQFRFSGGMIINHLAAVEAGRCGETVRILDGGNAMNKKHLVKILKAKGLKDSAIEEKLKGIKDDAVLTDAQIKDALADEMSMEGLMPALAEKLMPKMEEMVASDEFMSMMAETMATMMMGGGGSEMAEEMPAEEPMDQMPEEEMPMDADPMKYDSKPKQKDGKLMLDAKAVRKAIKDGAKKRARLIDSTRNMLPADTKVHDLTDRQIIEAALKDYMPEGVDIKTMSDDYLMGILDSIDADRIKSAKQFDEIPEVLGEFKDKLPNFADYRKMPEGK